MIECIQIAQEVGSDIISLWLADGTNYPGQDDLRRCRQRLQDSLQAIYAALPEGMRLLLVLVEQVFQFAWRMLKRALGKRRRPKNLSHFDARDNILIQRIQVIQMIQMTQMTQTSLETHA